MAITSGVSMNGLASPGTIAGCWRCASRSLTTPPHELADGDHTTGLGPFACSSLHPSESNVAAAPEDTFVTRTNEHLPSTLLSPSLKLLANSVRRSSFSGDVATGTCVHPPPDAFELPLSTLH